MIYYTSISILFFSFTHQNSYTYPTLKGLSYRILCVYDRSDYTYSKKKSFNILFFSRKKQEVPLKFLRCFHQIIKYKKLLNTIRDPSQSYQVKKKKLTTYHHFSQIPPHPVYLIPLPYTTKEQDVDPYLMKTSRTINLKDQMKSTINPRIFKTFTQYLLSTQIIYK